MLFFRKGESEEEKLAREAAEKEANDKLLSELFERAAEHAKHSPDVGTLEQKEHQRVFAYGRLKRDMPDHEAISRTLNPEAKWPGVTDQKYTVVKKRAGVNSFPIALESNYLNIPKLQIEGEIYHVPPQTVHNVLDIYMENRVKFIRKSVLVWVHWRDITPKFPQGYKITKEMRQMRAWMYVGAHDYWHRQIDAGFNFAPCSYHRPNNLSLDNKEFYNFTKQDFYR